jgi:hypothetical protein
MEMASFSLKIRHFFGDTSLTERSIGAGPPVIIQLSGCARQQVGNLLSLVSKLRAPAKILFLFIKMSKNKFLGFSFQSFGTKTVDVQEFKFVYLKAVEKCPG